MLIYSQCVTWSKSELTHSQFGKAAGVHQHRRRVMYYCGWKDQKKNIIMILLHLKKKQKKKLQQWKCSQYFEYSQCFILPSLMISYKSRWRTQHSYTHTLRIFKLIACAHASRTKHHYHASSSVMLLWPGGLFDPC